MVSSVIPPSPGHDAGRRRARRGRRLFAALVLVAAAGLAFLYADRHMLVSPQGRQCMRAAVSFRESGSLDVAPGRPYAWFGPLYPLALAGLASVGLRPGAAVALANSAALAALFLVFSASARRIAGRSHGLATVFFATLAVHPYLFRMARPDLIIAPASMLALLAASRWVDGFARRHLVTAAIACAAATTARYIAAVPLAPLTAWMLLRAARRPGGGRLLDVALLTGIGWGPLAAWLLRNRARTGFLTGMSRTEWREQAAGTDLGTNVLGTVKTILLDLFAVRAMGVRDLVYGNESVPHLPLSLVLMATAVVCIVAAFAVTRKRGGASGPAARDSDLDSADSVRLTRLVAAWTAVYVAALIAVWTWGNNDPIHTRYVAPVYGFVALLVFRAAERSRAGPHGRAARALLAVAAIAVAAPNVDKGLRLLGESPGDDLIRVSLHGQEDLWARGLEWDDFAPNLPPRRRGTRE